MSGSRLGRAGTIGIGCLLLGWAASVLPGFWRSADAARLASQIVGGRSFQPAMIRQTEEGARATASPSRCHPAAMRASVILRLYLYEDASNRDPAASRDEQGAELRDSLIAALRCQPSDGYLWLVLFSTANAVDGFSRGHLDYLRLSYLLAPHEGWVALKREAVALALLPALDADLAQATLGGFVELVDNGLYDESAAIFAGAPAEAHGRLLESLAGTSLANRERFAAALDVLLPGMPVPGVGRRDEQPWKH